ncbi:MAG: hypothetical protein M3O28_03430 [Actinomycetota bacterium]|nr:hypothetical protein [Actinomycetota bacterium]
MVLQPRLETRTATSVIATTNGQFIWLELMDDAGRVEHGVTVGAGKRLLFSEDRADGGLGLLKMRRTGAWERQDTDLWRAPVESER